MRKNQEVAVTILLLLLLGFLLYWRYLIATTRFFDVDEFSYLHWAAQVARGEQQYIDFLSYITPGFFWMLTPVFWIVGKSAEILTFSRLLAFFLFVCVLIALSVLWFITKGRRFILLPAIVLAFLPMPYDKFLEVRPDTVSMLLVLLGMIAQIKQRQLLSGVLYGVSLFFLVKTLPFVAVAAVIALFQKKPTLLLGIFVPWGLYFLWTIVSGQFPAVWYSLTTLVVEVSRNAVYYNMEPTLFFFPNASFYGGDNVTLSLGLVTNHSIWVIGGIWATYRVITTRRWSQAFVAGAFCISIFSYMKLFPLKHSQYLIPPAIFIAYYAADALAQVFDWMNKKVGFYGLLLVLVSITWLLVAVTQRVNEPKLYFTNAAQKEELNALVGSVPFSATVVDLEGKMLFWKEGYPICCIPFDYALGDISRAPLPLAAHLELYPALYIYQGDARRLNSLTGENYAYIKEHYAPVEGFGEKLWKRK